MLNSRPLGFYSPSQLVQDAKRHDVEVRAVDVMVSNVDCTLEGLPHPPAVRLGLRMIAGLKAESVDRIVGARNERVFDSAEDLARRAKLEQHEMKLLAAADALMSLSGQVRGPDTDAASHDQGKLTLVDLSTRPTGLNRSWQFLFCHWIRPTSAGQLSRVGQADARRLRGAVSRFQGKRPSKRLTATTRP